MAGDKNLIIDKYAYRFVSINIVTGLEGNNDDDNNDGKIYLPVAAWQLFYDTGLPPILRHYSHGLICQPLPALDSQSSLAVQIQPCKKYNKL